MDEYTDPWTDDVRAANVLYSSCQMNTHLHWYPELVGKQVQFNISGAGAMNDGTELDELVEREQAAPRRALATRDISSCQGGGEV